MLEHEEGEVKEYLENVVELKEVISILSFDASFSRLSRCWSTKMGKLMSILILVFSPRSHKGWWARSDLGEMKLSVATRQRC